MTDRQLPSPRFHPGDTARFKHAPDIECYVEALTWNDVGRCHYMVSWWSDGSRHDAQGIGERELMPPTPARPLGL